MCLYFELHDPFGVFFNFCDVVLSGLPQSSQAEEIIKEEMITMLHFDGFKNPVTDQSINKKMEKSVQATYAAYLEQHPYKEVTEEEITEVRGWREEL